MDRAQNPVHGVTAEAVLPRILYVGDVPVEPTLAGATLLFRLLSDYPPDSLVIVESNLHRAGGAENNLPGVRYGRLFLGPRRLLRTRFAGAFHEYLLSTARPRARLLDPLVRRFRPEGIITVAHGVSWLTAAALAERHRVPLHLIVHDEVVNTVPVSGRRQAWLEAEFAQVYRAAASRSCVSPYMARHYTELYGAEASVLYPSRAADGLEFSRPPDPPVDGRGIVFAYAGSVLTGAYARALVALAHALEPLGARLLLYSNLGRNDLERYEYRGDNVDFRGLVPSATLIRTLREEADVVFVPMSFDPGDRPNMEISFPSKLTDYTAAGLPIMIWGPAYCSAVRWAAANAGVAEVVASAHAEALAASAARLVHSPEHRSRLAERAIAVGAEYFAHASVARCFHDALRGKEREAPERR